MTEAYGSLLLAAAHAGALRWRTWSPATRLEAAEQQRLMVVLAGDSTCHYAHEWLRAIHADDEVVALLSVACVPVIVEAAAEPALVQRLQQVLSMTAGAEGVPLVAVVLPDGRPVGAVPYGPVRDGQRRAGLARILVDAVSAWHEAPDDFSHDAGVLATTCGEFDGPASDQLPSAELLVPSIESAVIEAADPLEGGFGQAPRTVAPAALEFLLLRAADPMAAAAVSEHAERCLQAVLAGACYDHLGGGCFRASTTTDWSLPLFDRRAGDNARLAGLLALAATRWQRSLYQTAAGATADWLLGLQRDDGLVAHGLAAESQAVDGGWQNGAAWLWRTDAAAEVIGREGAELVAARLLADERSELHDGWRVPVQRGAVDPATLERLPSWCHRLAMARAERPQPPLDACARLADQGQILVALRRLMAAGLDADARYAEAGPTLATALAQRVLADDPIAWGWTAAGAIAQADPASLGHAALGLAQWPAVAGATEAAMRCLSAALEVRDEHGRLVADTGLEVAPPVLAVDQPDSPGAAGVLAQAAWELGDTSAAVSLLTAHAATMRLAPAAACGLAAALLDPETGAPRATATLKA